MSRYKVPQDVEADDKLIGPFSFRQFIYLIIVALSCVMAWGLYQLFIPLAIIPLPIIIFFGALALPLRKDQPMETFMAAMVSFYIKPRQRLWDPDGIESLIEITVPKTVEVNRTKDLSPDEAQKRFGYLANVIDSQGWAVRDSTMPISGSSVNNDLYFEAQQAEDILDDSTAVARSLGDKLDQSSLKQHEAIINQMQRTTSDNRTDAPEPTTNSQQYGGVLQANDNVIINNPAQTTTPPVSTIPDEATITTSDNVPSAGIINLANSTDLSVQTIAHEANRINSKQNDVKEVFISLR